VELPFVINPTCASGNSSGGGTGFPSLAETVAARRDTTETIEAFMIAKKQRE
jgi:hypothetical protein